MRASVVIPTYNRLETLRRVVAGVGDQAGKVGEEVEIVVVDDGSTDGTGEWLARLGRRTTRPEITVVRQSNSGPAAARNRGVGAARGEIVMFLGDDTVPQSGWLAAHLEEHRLVALRSGEEDGPAEATGQIAVLGYTSFPPQWDTPFRRFINEYGAQFGYSIIEEPAAVPFNFFYTSNISLPRTVLLRLGGFREDFPTAAWEDIELAYRAARDGFRIRYQPRARTLHLHRVHPRTFCRRQRTSGLSAAIFVRLHPELEDFLGVARARRRRGLRRLRRAVQSALIGLGESLEGAVPRRVYAGFLDECYLEGLAEGLHSR